MNVCVCVFTYVSIQNILFFPWGKEIDCSLDLKLNLLDKFVFSNFYQERFAALFFMTFLVDFESFKLVLKIEPFFFSPLGI